MCAHEKGTRKVCTRLFLFLLNIEQKKGEIRKTKVFGLFFAGELLFLAFHNVILKLSGREERIFFVGVSFFPV